VPIHGPKFMGEGTITLERSPRSAHVATVIGQETNGPAQNSARPGTNFVVVGKAQTKVGGCKVEDTLGVLGTAFVAIMMPFLVQKRKSR